MHGHAIAPVVVVVRVHLLMELEEHFCFDGGQNTTKCTHGWHAVSFSGGC